MSLRQTKRSQIKKKEISLGDFLKETNCVDGLYRKIFIKERCFLDILIIKSNSKSIVKEIYLRFEVDRDNRVIVSPPGFKTLQGYLILNLQKNKYQEIYSILK